MDELERADGRVEVKAALLRMDEFYFDFVRRELPDDAGVGDPA